MDRNSLRLEVFNALVGKYDKDESDRLSRFLLEDLIGFDAEIGEEAVDSVNRATQRLIEGEPLQYITQVAHFYGHEYYVDEAVLIPRPETEELVYQVLQYLKKYPCIHPRILDIGTGSGCIPITLKKENSTFDIVAYDISRDALRVAIHNANKNGVQITFEDCNILSNHLKTPNQPFDIIVSNPPYIPTSEKGVMGDSVVKYEPHVALFTDDDSGLTFYQKIAELSTRWLSKKGVVFLELNEYHSQKIKEIYVNIGIFKSVEIVEDMQGKPRILIAAR